MSGADGRHELVFTQHPLIPWVFPALFGTVFLSVPAGFTARALGLVELLTPLMFGSLFFFLMGAYQLRRPLRLVREGELLHVDGGIGRWAGRSTLTIPLGDLEVSVTRGADMRFLKTRNLVLKGGGQTVVLPCLAEERSEIEGRVHDLLAEEPPLLL